MRNTRLAVLSLVASLTSALTAIPPLPAIAKQAAVTQSSAETKQATPQAVQERVLPSRRTSDRSRGFTVPTAHKNRRAGERAHRNWRKSRSAGRRAA